MFSGLVKFIQELYNTKSFIPLHAPQFNGNEKKYLLETIDSTFVSSVGEFVKLFEQKVVEYTGVKHAIATVNGTSALHVALRLVGVESNSEVITQSLTFVATCNAIRYCGATPVFVDVDSSTLGISPQSLEKFLNEHCEVRDNGVCWNKTSNKVVSACLPMHTFGFPVELDRIKMVCDKYNIPLVEDAAESLGSFYKNKHTGNMGRLAVLSFNGNKTVTTGGGGMILTNDDALAEQAKHITTTAKITHKWEFNHDEVGYNYRLPNLNAALGVAQMEVLPEYLKNKRETAHKYQDWGQENGVKFMIEPNNTVSNYWLNTVLLEDRQQRDKLLKITNDNNVMTRPIWKPMHQLEMNIGCQQSELINTEWLADRVVSVPSSIRM